MHKRDVWESLPNEAVTNDERLGVSFDQLCDRLFASELDVDGFSASTLGSVLSDNEPEAREPWRLPSANTAVAQRVNRASTSNVVRTPRKQSTPRRLQPASLAGLVQAHSVRKAIPRRFGSWLSVVALVVLCGFGLWRGDTTATIRSALGDPSAAYKNAMIRIDQAELGDRLVGRNPIRSEAESVEPDPTTWRRVHLQMQKQNGRPLWIELLRPKEWLNDLGVALGGTIFLDMPEMGALGEAEVTFVGPCPPIKPGPGTVVTGRFRHEADENEKVIRLKLEGQVELTGVTSSHAYWSVGREDFIPIGEFAVGELVDTEYGPKHVVSVSRHQHDNLLYNLETTEHVYRVGSLGTLVHNNCTKVNSAGQPIDARGRFLSGAGGDSVAAEAGRAAHEKLKKLADAKGWKTKTRTVIDGKAHIPDALTPKGRPIELKPWTDSGIRAGRRQLGRYEKAFEKNGRVIYYDPVTGDLLPFGR